MSRNHKSNDIPWWESELPVISGNLRANLWKRLPGLPDDHEDLVGETLLALTRQIRRHQSTLPKSWFQPGTPADDAERAHLHKLATVVLNRRIADVFRKRSRAPQTIVTGDPLEGAPDPATAALDRGVLLTKMLEVTMSVLAQMDPADRDLITFVSGAAGSRETLDDRERKRLQRLRKTLRDEIRRRLGAEVADLLGSTD